MTFNAVQACTQASKKPEFTDLKWWGSLINTRTRDLPYTIGTVYSYCSGRSCQHRSVAKDLYLYGIE